MYDQRCYCHGRICSSLSTKQPRELKYVSNVEESIELCKMRHLCDQMLWDDLFHGSLFDDCRVFITSCERAWCCWFCGTRWRHQRSSGDELLFATGTFVGVLNVGCMHLAFARCLVMVQKSFGLTFANVSEAPEALASYLKWLGGQPDGKYDTWVTTKVQIHPWREPLKEGTVSD